MKYKEGFLVPLLQAQIVHLRLGVEFPHVSATTCTSHDRQILSSYWGQVERKGEKDSVYFFHRCWEQIFAFFQCRTLSPSKFLAPS